MPRSKNGPALLWRDDRLFKDLAEELLECLNDPSTPEKGDHYVIEIALRLARGERVFRPNTTPAIGPSNGLSVHIVDGEIASWQAPMICVTVDEYGHLRWALEPKPNPPSHDRTRRLMTALALIWDDESLRRRFKRCPECGRFRLARTSRARFCDELCRAAYHRKRSVK